jgi:hypothetical protein
MKIAVAIVIAGILIAGSIGYYAHETSKPKRHCYTLREPNAYGDDFHDAWLELGIDTTLPSEEVRRERQERSES